ncbi:MAG TPA: hypothetical protein VGZ52_04395 [Acidimicrobiales bacterium]|jgi:hypothetical protein|nr:hypothetical protein [Acidimicrobiales bacterium]
MSQTHAVGRGEATGRAPRDVDGLARWEYLIVGLPAFPPATHAPGASDAVRQLNDQGDRGWEAVTMTALEDGTMAVLLKRRRAPS